MMEWKDASQMAEAVNQKQVSALELIEDSIARIERLNPALQAVVSKQYDQVRAICKQEAYLGKPFAGVPILLKDLGQQEEGQLSTAGSKLFAHHRATQTDTFVKRLKDLGFIILGRTNTPEFGFKNISDSALHGAVNLPCDHRRNAGGSSGGAAAAVAAGMVPLAGASDGGGSIRIPASFNGLIGLKTSRGRIPVGPTSYRGWQGASIHFALTKSMRDTKRLLYLLQDYQLEAPFPLAKLSYEAIFSEAFRPLRIAYCVQSPVGTKVSPEAKQAVYDVVAYLRQQGHDVAALEQLPLDGMELMRSFYLMSAVDTAQMFEQIEKDRGAQLQPGDIELMSWAIGQSGRKIPATLHAQTLLEWDQYGARMAAFHQEYDLLLTPTVAGVAPLQGSLDLSEEMVARLRQMDQYDMAAQQELIWEMFAESLALTPFTQHVNLTGQTAISLPTYRSKDGLPIGIQLSAAKGREDLLMQIGSRMEADGLFDS